VTQSKRVPAIFFRTESGGEPLREWLKSLPPEDRKLILTYAQNYLDYVAIYLSETAM